MPVSGRGPYDDANIFARMLRGEIPSRRVYEDEWAVAFHDIAPQAATHVLVIPRGPYVALSDFVRERIGAGNRRVLPRGRHGRAELGLEEPGFRVLANMGRDAGQEVPHFHVHLFGGGPLGPMLAAQRDVIDNRGRAHESWLFRGESRQGAESCYVARRPRRDDPETPDPGHAGVGTGASHRPARR